MCESACVSVVACVRAVKLCVFACVGVCMCVYGLGCVCV